MDKIAAIKARNDREMILHPPQPFLVLKRLRETGGYETAVVLASRQGKIDPREPIAIFIGTMFDNVDALLADGWFVD